MIESPLQESLADVLMVFYQIRQMVVGRQKKDPHEASLSVSYKNNFGQINSAQSGLSIKGFLLPWNFSATSFL